MAQREAQFSESVAQGLSSAASDVVGEKLEQGTDNGQLQYIFWWRIKQLLMDWFVDVCERNEKN